MCYARKYKDILISGDAKPLLQLSPNVKRHAWKLLLFLQSIMEFTKDGRQIRETYHLKWSTVEEDNLKFFKRYINGNGNYSEMLAWLKLALSKLPVGLQSVIIFNTMTGLRPTEACKVIELIKTGKA